MNYFCRDSVLVPGIQDEYLWEIRENGQLGNLEIITVKNCQEKTNDRSSHFC